MHIPRAPVTIQTTAQATFFLNQFSIDPIAFFCCMNCLIFLSQKHQNKDAANRTPRATRRGAQDLRLESAGSDDQQAQQNIDPTFRFVLDPCLTSEGERQSKQLAISFPFHDSVETVFSSPLQRALQTALLAFHASLSPRSKIIAHPLAQETSEAPCDTGQDRACLERAFDAADIDLTCVEPGWNSKTSQWSQDDEAVRIRAAELRDFLACRPEREVVLVTHGYFLRYLTEVLPCEPLFELHPANTSLHVGLG